MAWHSRRVICAAVAATSPGEAPPRAPGRPPAFLPLDLEPVLPAQWSAGDGVRLQPAKRLMLAVLTDALELVLQEPAPPTSRRAFLQRRAADWIYCNDRHWLFSFLNVCDTLGVDARRLRTAVTRLVAQRDASGVAG